MRLRFLPIAAVFVAAVLRPSVAMAGMPSPMLTDWAAMRFETMSFFIVLLLLCTVVIRWLWNVLTKEFPNLPRLGFRTTLAGVLLWAMLLAVVLTMIAGARELLTPGAWEKQGVLYKVASPQSPPPPAPADSSTLDQRKDRLEKLRAAL